MIEGFARQEILRKTRGQDLAPDDQELGALARGLFLVFLLLRHSLYGTLTSCVVPLGPWDGHLGKGKGDVWVFPMHNGDFMGF